MRYLLRWTLFSLAFVPLLVNTDTLFPYIFTKTLLIRSAVTLFWVLFAIFFFTRKRESLDLLNNNWRFVKNPIYIFVSIFILLMLFSTIFAVDPIKAFFGDIERGEGYIGMLHFFAFFVASLLVFKKEDWATFFRFSLIAGAVLLFDSVQELATGKFDRAQSLIGNPAFLAGYFLFVTLSAFLSFSLSKNRIGWRIFSFLMIFGGIISVFLTGTRGAILGLVAGVLLSALYFAVKGKEMSFNLGALKLDMQKAGIAFLAASILGIGGFALTRENAFWQKVPGLERFSDLSFSDPTLQTRIISAGVSLNAINPIENGIHRFLIGYGWENFNIAYNKHFNPEYMRYESLWFDRAHNKVFDVLVMTGTLGLIAYLGAWFSLFYMAFKRIPEKGIAVPLIFFGSAYFIQNLFVFDQISTYIPFFAFLAFAVFASSERGEFELGQQLSWFKKLSEKILPYKLPIIGGAFSFALVAYTFVPYSQSIAFIRVLQAQSVDVAIQNLDAYTKPYNYAQSTIRNRLLTQSIPLIGNQDPAGFANTALALHEEFVAKEPYDPRDISLIATAYRLKGNLGDPGAYEKAEEYFLRALALSPTRQDHFYNLATLYIDQGNFQKMQEYAGTMLAQSPTVPRTKILYATLIVREGGNRYAESVRELNAAISDPMVYFGGESEENVIRTTYSLSIDYFFNAKDGENFLTALRGARDFEFKIDKINKAKFEAKVINSMPPSMASELEANLNKFTEGGFDALAN